MSGCESFCEHGGICILEAGHDGLHDSRYCQWDDERALSREEADAVFLADPRNPLSPLMKALVVTFRRALWRKPSWPRSAAPWPYSKRLTWPALFSEVAALRTLSAALDRYDASHKARHA